MVNGLPLSLANPTLAAEWHPSKNGNLTPEMITCGSGKTVWWKCQNGHEWTAAINNRSRGSGCPFCSGHKVWPGYNDLSTTHPALATEWHPTKNFPLTPREVSFGSTKKVWWLCKYNHEWLAAPNTRRKNGCPYCSGRAILPGFNDLLTVAPNLAEEWHPTKNGSLTPSSVGRGSQLKIWWLGKCGHEWQSTINTRFNGHGCPVCVQRYRTSFPEQAVFYYINKFFPEAISRYKLNSRIELDVFIPSSSMGIEYDGIAWHNSDEAIQRDLRKYQFCKDHNIKLIRIKETIASISKKANCDYVIPVEPNPSYSDLNDAIKKLLTTLGQPVVDYSIDVAQDSQYIKESFLFTLSTNSLATVNPSLASEWHPTKNGCLTPNMFNPYVHDKVWWLGKCGHTWQATIASRNSGKGCPFCSNNKLLSGFNDLATLNPSLAEEWHPTKNGQLSPKQVLVNSSKKVWWLGKCTHEWEAPIAYRNKGGGCPYCSGRKIGPQNSLANNNRTLAEEWHPTKNGEKLPTMYSCGSSEKVWWKCKYGHEWQASIHNRSRGHGCPVCARIKRGINDLETTMPTLAKEWHPSRNGTLTPQDVGRGSRLKVWWLGNCGHEWQAVISNRAKGTGCPYCSNHKK